MPLVIQGRLAMGIQKFYLINYKKSTAQYKDL